MEISRFCVIFRGFVKPGHLPGACFAHESAFFCALVFFPLALANRSLCYRDQILHMESNLRKGEVVMATFSFTGKVLASLAAAAALTISASPALAGGEIASRPMAPPPAMMPPPAPAPQAAPYNGQSTGNSLVDIVLYYVPNRVLDAIDIARVNIGIGCGFGFNIRATELAEIGYGQYSTTRFGMKGRVMPVYDEKIDEGGIGFLGWVNGCLQRDPSEVGADLHLGVIGAQAAVSLVEVVDFVAGFALIDLQGDDLGPNPWD